MEVITGYKNSDIGFIPLDWDVKELHEIAKISRGRFSPRPRNNPIYYGGIIPFVQTGDVTRCNGVIKNYTQTLNELGLSVSILYKKGTILMTIAANIGYAGILEMDMACPDSLVAIDGIPGVNNRFLNFWFNYRRQKIEDLSTSGAQKNLNIELLSPFKVPVPDFEEQTAIATALSDTDALISSLEKLIAKKRNIKQGVMQELLRPKDGWEIKQLVETADSKVKWSFIGGPFGSNLKSSDYTSEGIRVIQLQNIGDGTFINDSEIYTSVEKANELLSNNIYPGDIILSKMGDPVARACIIPDFHRRYLMCSDGIRLCVDKSKYNPYFIYVYINSPTFRSMAENASTGSTRKRIGLTELKGLKIWCPSIQEQNKIGQILMDIDNEILMLESKLSKYRQIKSGMMQSLLTGKIRLV